ncbi:MAG: Crp/Fnr family transcriptional regulator [Hyphomicrobiales bacterium]|nr:MAG: Crp/Fnr family transcriptional regulator [Hyphomicrobiales bacterium]
MILEAAKTRNKLLRRMSQQDFETLQPLLTTTNLNFRQRLQGANRTITDVYFIEHGIASVIAIGGGERRQAEVTMVGDEGLAGCSIILGVERSPCEIFMQVEGVGQKISSSDFRAAILQSSSMMDLMHRYVHTFVVQGAFTALANARGTIPERLARWLLMARDRSLTDELVLTHDFLSLMLGVRRAGVTGALHDFEHRGLISTSRGLVKVLDREGLEEMADGLYGVAEAEYERCFSNLEF